MKISNKPEYIIKKIRSVIGSFDSDNPIFLHEPYFKGTRAFEYLKDCIDTGWVSSAGNWVKTFEKKLCDFTGADFCIAVTNGTVGLRLALFVVGVRKDDEVILPPLSFVGTANAISHLNAVPHFIDIENQSLGMCPDALEKRLEEIAIFQNGFVINRKSGRRISAILPVDVFGMPCNIAKLRIIAQKWSIPIVEDSAEALGSKFRVGQELIHCGLSASIGVLSFNGNKLITTGGGGALITNNEKFALLARHLSTTAKLSHDWEFNHDQVGWNDRMPNINAALGFAQLENIDERIKHKKNLLMKYLNVFDDCLFADILNPKNKHISNNWLISLRLKGDTLSEILSLRNELLEKSVKQGLFIRPCWNLLNSLPMYKSCPSGDLSIANNESHRIINLPSSHQLDF